MTDKAETIVWEKNTETKEVKQITLKQVVGMLNTQNSIEFTIHNCKRCCMFTR